MKHERIFLNENDPRVYIDTYVANVNTVRDAMLVIPDGGYTQVCTDREGEPIALEFFSRGYNCFVLNYRCGRPEDVYPVQIVDAGSAMIYIKEHASEFKINPDRVFAVGFSAGGHLCASLATMYGYPEVIQALGEKASMIKPTAAILSYPVALARANTHSSTYAHLLGKPLSEYTPEEVDKFSIDTAITEKTSPMFIWHTREDNSVPVESSLKVALALTKAGVNYRLSIYPYGHHGIALANEITATREGDVQPMAEGWVTEAVDFIKSIK